jgi:hypothetical protein
MWSAATVLVCALDLLGRSASSFPPIVLLDVRPPHVSALAEGFVQADVDTIFVLTSTSAFRNVQESSNKCGDVNAVRKIASVLVHEEWHVRHGPDERRAYEAQLMALTRMNAGAGNPVYASVLRSMRQALERTQDTPAGVGAAAADARRTDRGFSPPALSLRHPDRLTVR